MAHDSVEEHLAELAELVAQAEAMGVDLWPETKPARPWAKFALASFMIIMIVSWGFQSHGSIRQPLTGRASPLI